MTAPSIKEALELKRCPFCGGSSVTEGVFFANGSSKKMGAVRCADCGARAPKVAWNTRATLSPPAGDRREAIARALWLSGGGMLRVWEELKLKTRPDLNQRVKECWRDADAILASGLVQDEAGWRTMDSAPKDGTDILVLVEESGEQFVCYFDGSGWRYATFPGGVMICAPDYWMPLPAIRSARDGGAES